MSADDELEGTTLRVYLAVVRENKPVGPRDVMRSANLSSPSVAYRHLQKLESLRLIEKNSYGEYAAKQRQNIEGHVWIGRWLVPRLVFYSFFFIGILSIEILIVVLKIMANEPFQYDFIFLVSVTTSAAVLFLIEGTILGSKLKKRESTY